MPSYAATEVPVELRLLRPGAADEGSARDLRYLGADRYGEWFGQLGEIHEVFVFGPGHWWGQWTLGGPRPRLGRGPRASRSTCHIGPPPAITRAEDGTPESILVKDLGIRIVTEPDADAWVEGETTLAGGGDTDGENLQDLRLSKHRQFAVVAAFEEPFRYHYLRWGAQLPRG